MRPPTCKSSNPALTKTLGSSAQLENVDTVERGERHQSGTSWPACVSMCGSSRVREELQPRWPRTLDGGRPERDSGRRGQGPRERVAGRGRPDGLERLCSDAEAARQLAAAGTLGAGFHGYLEPHVPAMLNGALAITDRRGQLDAAGRFGRRRSRRSPRAGPMPPWWMGLLGVLCLALGACAGPVGAVRVDPKVAHRDVARSAITTGEPSWPTRNVLFEQGLVEALDERPEAALAELHREMVARGGDQDLLFALAELSFLHGQATRQPGYHLAAVVYAYAFLFPEGAGDAPGRFDPRVRMAADLYNWALTTGLASEDGSEVVPRGGTLGLPFGRIEVAFDPATLRAGERELYRFIPVAELDVYGLEMRYRWPGLGAPLAASTRPIESSPPGRDMVSPRLQVPVIALLRIPDARRALVEGRAAHGHVGVPPRLGRGVGHDRRRAGPPRERPVGGPGADVQRRADPGARDARAPGPAQRADAGATPAHLRHAVPFRARPGGLRPRHGLEPGPVGADVQPSGRRPRDTPPLPVLVLPVRLGQPHRAVGAPPARGADHGRGAARPRGAGSGPASDGPDRAQSGGAPGQDAGHQHRGSALERGQPEAAGRAASCPTRPAICSAAGFFLEPLPTVSRAIFICTPHRGSFVAGRRVLANLTRQLLTLPFAMTGVAADINRNPGAARVGFVPTAVDNMSPEHPFILGLQAIATSPSVTVNSIIAVEGDGKVELGDDGVVKYSAAHIAPVESELVVRSSHSAQGNPHTIEEVRRILRRHAGLK